jgi:hypothetical protein
LQINGEEQPLKIMEITINVCELAVDKSAIYCIKVMGCLDQGWSPRLGGLKIYTNEM